MLTPGRVMLGLGILVPVLLVVFMTIRTVDKPTVQLNVFMPGMGEHLVNVWLDPDPPTTSGVTLIGQMTDLTGMAMTIGAMEIRAGRLGSESSLTVTGERIKYEFDDLSKRGRFQARLEFPQPGQWWVDLVFRMNGQQATARMPIFVSG